MLPPDDPNIIVAIVVAVAAIFLYTRDDVPLESASLAILVFILVWFELVTIVFNGERVRAVDFVAGFGNEALITVIALIVLARSLEVTNALQPLGYSLAGLWKVQPRLAFLATLVSAAVLSMFLNNTPVVAALMPLLVAVSMQAKVPASGLLMPVGFATIVGGMATTIGTSTNLLVVSVASDLGVAPFQMFDFALPVVIVGSIAIVYLWLIAPLLLPERHPPVDGNVARVFDARLSITDKSSACSQTLSAITKMTKNRMKVRRVDRKKLSVARLPLLKIQAGDFLHVTDTFENLKHFEHQLGAKLLAADRDQAIRVDDRMPEQVHFAEIVILEGSPLEKTTLDASHVLSHYGLDLLCLHRPTEKIAGVTAGATSTLLRAGDVLVVQGSAKGLARLKRAGLAVILDGNIDLPRPAKALIALIIVSAVVVLAATGLVRISQAAVTGVTMMILTRCLTWKDVRGAVDRRIVMVIVTSLALGLAMMATGAANYIAQVYVDMFGHLPTAVTLGGLMLVFALLTEVVTNNAIAVLGTPIAVSIARALDAPVEPFVLAVLYGANMSYLTPVGYQTNLLVMSAGGYKFSDFWRAGAPLQLIMWLGLSLILPILYDL